jgi:hypothetical protein
MAQQPRSPALAHIPGGIPLRYPIRGHRKGQTLVIKECKEDEVQKLAYDKMMGKCIPLAYPNVTCDNIRFQVHQ